MTLPFTCCDPIIVAWGSKHTRILPWLGIWLFMWYFCFCLRGNKFPCAIERFYHFFIYLAVVYHFVVRFFIAVWTSISYAHVPDAYYFHAPLLKFFYLDIIINQCFVDTRGRALARSVNFRSERAAGRGFDPRQIHAEPSKHRQAGH